MNCEEFLSAVLYDVAEQRRILVKDFRRTLESGPEENHTIFYHAPEYGLVVPVFFRRIDDRSVRTGVGAGTIVEMSSIRYRLMRLSLMRRELESRVGEEGGFVLPIGAGVFADFRERPHTVESDRIYMEQSEWEKMSLADCAGMVRPEGSYLETVDSGEFACRFVSEYNDGGINRLYPEFEMRSKPGDMLKCETKSVVLVSAGKNANWPDLALIRREQFLRNGMTTLKERMKNNPVLRYSAEALRVKIFLAQKMPFVPDGSSPVKVMTTCAEAEEILEGMREAGIEKAVVTLVGWNLGGHDGAYPSHFPVEESVGGEPALRKLIRRAKALGYQIVPHDNATDLYRSSPSFDYEYVARTESGEPLAAGIWGGGQAYKACPRVFLERWGSEFARIRELGFEGHYYMDAQASALWKCHSPRHPADEKEFALALSSLTTAARVLYGAVAAETGSAYLLPYVDEISRFHTVLTDPRIAECWPETLRSLEVRGIPFWHVALHGLVLYQDRWVHLYPDLMKGRLYETAFGARPSMEVSYRRGGNGDDWRESLRKILPNFELCFRKLKVQTELIESFREPEPGVYEIRYANGVELKVDPVKGTLRTGNLPA